MNPRLVRGFLFKNIMLEIECKIALDNTVTSESLLHAPWLKGITPTITQLISDYFDTTDHLLKQNAYALRIRHKNHQLIQTLKKSLQEESSLKKRYEWEYELKQAVPDLQHLPKNIQQELQHILNRKALEKIFTTRFTRHCWLYNDQQGNLIEIAFDQGEVFTTHKQVPIYEIELELLQGDENCLSLLEKKILQWTGKNLPPPPNKAARGYALLEEEIS